MRMARAFIAAVPLALVLVAALVVPVALTPGTFGFHDWPTAKPERVATDPVPAIPAPVATAPARPDKPRGRDRDARRAPGNLVAVRPDSATGPGDPGATRGAPRTPAPIVPPAPATPGESTSGPGGTPPAEGVTPPSTPTVPQPETPAGEGEDAPAPQVQVAEGIETPVLRGAPQEVEVQIDAPPAPEDACDWHPQRSKHHPHKGGCKKAAQDSFTEGS